MILEFRFSVRFCFYLIVNALCNLIQLKVVVRTCYYFLQKIAKPKQLHKICWSGSALCYTISNAPQEHKQRKLYGPILSPFTGSSLGLFLVLMALFIELMAQFYTLLESQCFTAVILFRVTYPYVILISA